MVKYQMKLMFDWGSGTCLWSINDAARKKYDYPVDISTLPISIDLIHHLEKLCDEHDQAFNWEDPTNDLLWNQEECEVFMKKAKNIYENLCRELGAEYDVIFWDRM